MNKTQAEPIAFHVQSKTKLRHLSLGVVLTIIMAAAVFSVAAFHWFNSVSEHDMQGIKMQSANYLGGFSNYRESAPPDSDSVAILATEKRGDFGCFVPQF